MNSKYISVGWTGLCLLLAGCGLPVKYSNYSANPNPIYAATAMDIGFTYAVITDQGSTSILPARGFAALVPLALLELPVAIAVDTVTLPYDSYTYYRNKKPSWFWARAFDTGVINSNAPLEKYFARNYYTEDVIRKKLAMPVSEINPDCPPVHVVDCLIDLSLKHRYRFFDELSKCAYLTEGQIEKLYFAEAERLAAEKSVSNIYRLQNLLKLENCTPGLLHRISLSRNEFALVGLLTLDTYPAESKGAVLAALMDSPSRFIQGYVVSNPLTTPAQQAHLSTSTNRAVLMSIAGNPKTAPEILDALARRDIFELKNEVLRNPSTPPETIEFLYNLAVQNPDDGAFARWLNDFPPALQEKLLDVWAYSESVDIQRQVSFHPLVTPEQLTQLSTATNEYVVLFVARNSKTPPEILDAFARRDVPALKEAVLRNPTTSPATIQFLYDTGAYDSNDYSLVSLLLKTAYPVEAKETILKILLDSTSANIQKAVASHPLTTPEQLAKLSASTNQAALSAIARNPRTPPETLDAFARRGAPEVKQNVLQNPETPLETIQFLYKTKAYDPDDSALLELLKNADYPMEAKETLLNILVQSSSGFIQMQVATNSLTTPEQLTKLSASTNQVALRNIARNPKTPPETLDALARRDSPELKKEVLRNPSTSPETIRFLYNAGTYDPDDRYLPELLKNADYPAAAKEALLDILASSSSSYSQRMAAAHPLATPAQLKRLSATTDWRVLTSIVENPRASSDTLDELARRDVPELIRPILLNPSTSSGTMQFLCNLVARDPNAPDYVRYRYDFPEAFQEQLLDVLAESELADVQQWVARHPLVTPEQLAKVATTTDERVLTRIAGNKRTAAATLDELARRDMPWLKILVLRNPSTSPETVQFIYDTGDYDPEDSFLGLLLNDANYPAEAKEVILKILLNSSSRWPQETVASHPLTTPEQLTELSSSTNQFVLWAIAKNPNVPPEALDVLARNEQGSKRNVLENQATLPETIQFIYDNDPDKNWNLLAVHPNTPIRILAEMYKNKRRRDINKIIKEHPVIKSKSYPEEYRSVFE